MFIAICGIDGSGKTTLVKELSNRLKISGKKVKVESEPTEWLIKNCDRPLDHLSSLERIALFSADRSLHQDKIYFGLKRAHCLICDRYSLCTYAYNCESELDADVWRALNMRFVQPDLTVLLDCDPEVAIARIGNKKDNRFSEFHQETFLREVRERYLQKVNCMLDSSALTLDAALPIEINVTAIARKLDTFRVS